MKIIKLLFANFLSILILSSCFRAVSDSYVSDIGFAISLANDAGIIVDPTGNPYDNYVVIKSSQLANPVDRLNSYDVKVYGKFTKNGLNANVGPISINSRTVTADINNLYGYDYLDSSLAEGKALFGSNVEVNLPGIDIPQAKSANTLGVTYMVVPKEIFPSNITLPGTRLNRSINYPLVWNPDPTNQYQKVKIDVSYYKSVSQFNSSGMPNSITSLNYLVPDNGNFVIPQSDLSRFPVGAYLSISIARASMVTQTNNVVYVSIVEAHTIPILVVDNSSFCLATQNISGDNLFCTTSNSYFIPNLPAGAKVTWSATPAGIVTINSPISNSTTLTKVNNGIIKLTAVVSDVCGGDITIFKQNIIVGTPTPVGISGPGHNLCYNGRTSEKANFSVSNPNTLLTYQWKIDGVTAAASGGYASIQVDAFRWGVGMHEIKVRSSSVCGYSDWYTSSFIIVDCSTRLGSFSASPNPTTGEIQVEAVTTETSTFIKEIQITDKSGAIKKKFNFNADIRKYKISIAELTPDVYFIRIYDGKTWVTKKVIRN